MPAGMRAAIESAQRYQELMRPAIEAVNRYNQIVEPITRMATQITGNDNFLQDKYPLLLQEGHYNYLQFSHNGQ